jgi:hypothetical protein
MDKDPQQELRDVVGRVRAYLTLQQELGLERTDLRWPEPVAAARPTLEGVREELGDCTRCKLHAHRTQIVFGVGNPNAGLVFVGEAPGADEDAQGEPFVGRAGQLLTKIIEAMGMRREDVYICNIIKCRPPNNRTPEADEIVACQPSYWATAPSGRNSSVRSADPRRRRCLTQADFAPARPVPRFPWDPAPAHVPPGVPAAESRRKEDGVGGHETTPPPHAGMTRVRNGLTQP